MLFYLQVRKPGKAYETHEQSRNYAAIHWSWQQWLVPGQRCSVRIVDNKGTIIVRATPKR